MMAAQWIKNLLNSNPQYTRNACYSASQRRQHYRHGIQRGSTQLVTPGGRPAIVRTGIIDGILERHLKGEREAVEALADLVGAQGQVGFHRRVLIVAVYRLEISTRLRDEINRSVR